MGSSPPLTSLDSYERNGWVVWGQQEIGPFLGSKKGGPSPPFWVVTRYRTKSDRQQVTLAANPHRLSAGLDPQLLVEVFQVVLDGVNTQHQLFGDLSVTVAPS